MHWHLCFTAAVPAAASSARVTEERSVRDTESVRAAPPQSQGVGAQAPAAGGGGGFFSALRGGAAGLMKNMKDASSKVMETVSAYVSYSANMS